MQKKKTDKKEPEKKDLKDVEEEIIVEQGKEMSELEKKAEEYLEGWKRCQADFENYKKMQGESQKDMARYAAQSVLLEIIPVVDNFHASTAHIPEDQKDGGWVTGIMYIQKQLENVLSENGVSEIEVKVGDSFDPNFHEAISMEENKIHPVKSAEGGAEQFNRVKKIIQKGYKMGERIIRPAKVTVE
ncbi:MAG: heat shock protein GrpE [Candidatus Moranbacteria bacterium GW2011_GWE1_49_15]|nr:MAG: heat shock protein GrpE [Candidatus Moranbacteria bacterium GW2011_GWE2_47_10]KKW07180.1 MAG: heat shock protein GrpE [Candidatus Moranbacteria bacterium GW2011_GWE1_49_15]HBP01326.1 nucleotide exchange factor GrpE [Candidatus Moranbacteria bacterium]